MSDIEKGKKKNLIVKFLNPQIKKNITRPTPGGGGGVIFGKYSVYTAATKYSPPHPWGGGDGLYFGKYSVYTAATKPDH